MSKYVTTEDDLFKLQWDALYESIENNPYLPYKTNSLNKSLTTTNKRIIKAINEVNDSASNSKELVDSFVARFNNVIGDETADPNLFNELKKIDTNFFKAIVTINNKLSDNTTKLESLESVDNDIQSAIDDLQKAIAKLEENCVEDFEEVCIVNTESQVITLSHTPKNKDCIDLYVNGIHYPNSSFNMFTNGLAWLLKEDDEGFLLEDDFEVIAKYDYLNE